jgi:hypothetical protein
MLWVAAGLVILGAACGAVFRVLFLIAALLVATTIVVVSDVAQGSPNVFDVFIDAVIAIVALQVGYSLGIGARALVYARRRRQEPAIRSGQARYPVVGSRRERH